MTMSELAANRKPRVVAPKSQYFFRTSTNFHSQLKIIYLMFCQKLFLKREEMFSNKLVNIVDPSSAYLCFIGKVLGDGKRLK